MQIAGYMNAPRIEMPGVTSIRQAPMSASSRTRRPSSLPSRVQVHRHRLPSRARRTSAASGRGFSRSRSRAAMSMPGVQEPHWRACRSWKARCDGVHTPSRASPWTVVTTPPSAWTASMLQLLTPVPSTVTEMCVMCPPGAERAYARDVSDQRDVRHSMAGSVARRAVRCEPPGASARQESTSSLLPEFTTRARSAVCALEGEA
ncbi:hypothetical protein CF54_13235 [Streptomyces sp. Tu 6176]|nr:hypothetical protein CF54_13235 [Streptomyces sp. Tu 6176]